MSILPGAHDFTITSSEFIKHKTNVNVSCGQGGIDILLEASAPEAAVDAEERNYAPSCFPDTRTQYIEDITVWATASNSNYLPIYWMRGPACVGKSAIAQTCAQKVKESGHLGAVFFFSINGRRKDHKRLFPTLAYQLSTILDDYCENVNRRMLRDKTVVTKTLKTQFELLIVEPLQELKEQGKEIRMRPIFIDGLDECESKDAQVEIIELIAASIQAQSTPFHWAVFSRAEPRIVSTFERPQISPYCRFVNLPISRDSDKEIEIYLRGEFKNILRRRNMTLSLPWPSDEDIKELVNVAAGLFAYCATVLPLVDTHSFSGFKETLQAVLEVIAKPYSHPIPLFADLDKLYTLILQRVPEDILHNMLFVLYWVTECDLNGESKGFSVVCNTLGISETIFKRICYHLQAVMTYHEPAQPFQVADPCVDTHSHRDQDPSFEPSSSIKDQVRGVYGSISLLHKSFHDFLRDPKRSSAFCVHGDTIIKAMIDRLVEQHHRFASSYIIQGSRLVLAPGVTSSALLSWPQGTEFVDSCLKLRAFWHTSFFTFDWPVASSFTRSLSDLKKLTELDRCKSFIAQRMYLGPGLWSDVIFGCPRPTRVIDGMTFICVRSEGYDKFDLEDFLVNVKILEKWGVIKAFRPYLPSALASVHNSYSRYKPGKHYGLYELGCGEKSVVWYWEFDTKKRYYHEFHTMNYTKAMRIYQTEKFKMWEEEWVPP